MPLLHYLVFYRPVMGSNLQAVPLLREPEDLALPIAQPLTKYASRTPAFSSHCHFSRPFLRVSTLNVSNLSTFENVFTVKLWTPLFSIRAPTLRNFHELPYPIGPQTVHYGAQRLR